MRAHRDAKALYTCIVPLHCNRAALHAAGIMMQHTQSRAAGALAVYIPAALYTPGEHRTTWVLLCICARLFLNFTPLCELARAQALADATTVACLYQAAC